LQTLSHPLSCVGRLFSHSLASTVCFNAEKLSDEQDVEKGKQNDKNNDQKENGVKTENGIANTAFENAAECENVETCDTQVQGNASKPESLSEVAVEEAKTGGDANGVADAISEDKVQ